jgi:coenzyme F420-reducing hydrogenase delta subunit
LLKSFLEHTGIEPGRLQFSWVSSSEAGKFVDLANKVTAEVKALGPAKHLIKTRAEVA